MAALSSAARAGDVQAIRLLFEYTVGSGAEVRRNPVFNIDREKLRTREGCMECLGHLVDAQVRGDVDESQAAALRSSIELALRGLGIIGDMGAASRRPIVVNVQSYGGTDGAEAEAD